MEYIQTQKRCSKCKTLKSITEFHKDKSHKDRLRNQCKICKNKYTRQYTIKNRESISANKKEYRKNNGDAIKQRKKINYARRQSDESYKLGCTLRRSLTRIIRSKDCNKIDKSIELIGCSFSHAHLYLNEKNMNCIENCDVDHIIPCSVFDFTLSNHQKACFHYTNLQKLPSKENQHVKRDKLPKNFNIDSWIEKQLEQISRIEDDSLDWKTVLNMQKQGIFQGFVHEKWW